MFESDVWEDFKLLKVVISDVSFSLIIVFQAWEDIACVPVTLVFTQPQAKENTCNLLTYRAVGLWKIPDYSEYLPLPIPPCILIAQVGNLFGSLLPHNYHVHADSNKSVFLHIL